MADVTLGYEEMDRAAKRLSKGQEEITNKLSELDKMITSLTQSEFKMAKASPKFQESFKQWHSGAKNTIAGLDGMNKFLTNAVQKAQQLDEGLTNELNRQ